MYVYSQRHESVWIVKQIATSIVRFGKAGASKAVLGDPPLLEVSLRLCAPLLCALLQKSCPSKEAFQEVLLQPVTVNHADILQIIIVTFSKLGR